MFLQVAGHIRVRLEKEEEDKDRSNGGYPEETEAEDDETAEDDRQVHGEDPVIGPHEL